MCIKRFRIGGWTIQIAKWCLHGTLMMQSEVTYLTDTMKHNISPRVFYIRREHLPLFCVTGAGDRRSGLGWGLPGHGWLCGCDESFVWVRCAGLCHIHCRSLWINMVGYTFTPPPSCCFSSFLFLVPPPRLSLTICPSCPCCYAAIVPLFQPPAFTSLVDFVGFNIHTRTMP